MYSVLEQTYPCHVVLSDQGSTDNTFEIMRAIVANYSGPHRVSLLRCPITEPRGMRGMNAHLDWIMSQTDEDVIVITSADDLAMPERTSRCAKAFEEHKPDMVLTAMHNYEPDGTYFGSTVAPREDDGLVTPEKCINMLVGGSTAHAWTREFYEAVGGFCGAGAICGFDAFWPFLATVRNGAWYIRDHLHVYVRHCDPNNTGLEGVFRAAEEDGKLALEELMHFQVTTSYINAAKIMQRWECKNNDETVVMLYNEILGRTSNWSRVRSEMTVRGIAPLPMKA